ncbi:O-antigen translocase [bacterium]|nr:O-antigen translocase [bacterium]
MSTTKHQLNHRGILKASSLIGGSAFINVLIGMVKTKFIAILLGTGGVGLIGVYGSVIAMVSTVSGMGIGTSGVRQIAEAHGKGDADTIAKTVIALRRAVWITGFLGAMAMVAGSPLWSWLSFGNSDYTLAIAILGITILLAAVTVGQRCILQGTRRIADLAKINVLGALAGTVISIPCYYIWGQQGIVPSLVLCAVATLVISWRFCRRVEIKAIVSPWQETKSEVFYLLKFGLPIMLASLTTVLATFLIRVILIRQVGLDGVGIYQAAFLLSGVIANFVLTAMGADYYPRLTAIAHDNQRIGVEVNAQTEIGLLLAVPGLAATIIFAPLVISIFYSPEFVAAVDVLRWMVLGVFGRIVSWPLGFVILAKGKGKTFLFTELSANLFLLFTTWFCTEQMGLPGTGAAFALLYLYNSIVVLAVAYALTKETWSVRNLVQIIVFGGVLAGLGLNCVYMKPFWAQWLISLTTLSFLSVYCLHRLSTTTGITMRDLKGKFFSNGK